MKSRERREWSTWVFGLKEHDSEKREKGQEHRMGEKKAKSDRARPWEHGGHVWQRRGKRAQIMGQEGLWHGDEDRQAWASPFRVSHSIAPGSFESMLHVVGGNTSHTAATDRQITPHAAKSGEAGHD